MIIVMYISSELKSSGFSFTLSVPTITIFPIVQIKTCTKLKDKSNQTKTKHKRSESDFVSSQISASLLSFYSEITGCEGKNLSLFRSSSAIIPHTFYYYVNVIECFWMQKKHVPKILITMSTSRRQSINHFSSQIFDISFSSR